MADQTVSLELTGDASDLIAAVQDSGQAMEEMADAGSQAAADVESAMSGQDSMWEQHSAAIQGTAAAAGAAGAAFEGLARAQQDNRAVAGRLANSIEGETTDSIMELASELHNATTDMDALVHAMEVGAQQGLDSGRDLQEFASFWDMVADATGESHVALADASVALRTVGIAAGDEAQALDAFGFIAQETTGSVGEFLRFIERTGPELRELGADVDDAAAIMGVLEGEFGMSGRTARQEFRSAISESDGTLQGLLDTLGVGPEVFAEYRGAVSESSGVIEDNAEAFAESRTAVQELTARLEGFIARNGDLVAALSDLSPILMGAGGLVVGFGQLAPMVGPLATKMGALARNTTGASNALGGMTRLAGVAAAGYAAGEAIEFINEQMLELAAGTPATTDELNLAADSIVQLGEAPESVAGAFDGLGSALETVNGWGSDVTSTLAGIPGLGQALHVVDPSFGAEVAQLERAEDAVGAFGDALSDAVAEGNTDRLAVLMSELSDATGLTGDELETFAREQWPEYAQALDSMALDTDDAAESTDDLTESLNDTGEAAFETADAVDEYMDAVRRATDPVFRLMDAVQAVDDAQANYDQTMADSEATIEDQQAAAADLMVALQDLEAAAIDGDLSFDEFAGELDRWVDSGHLTAEQAALIRDRVAEARDEADAFEGTRTMTINAEGNAWDRMRALIGMRSQLGDTTSRHHYGREERADGGPVDSRMGPVLVGEEGPELVTFSSAGFVHDAETTAGMLMPTPQSSTVHVTMPIMLDGRQIGESQALVDAASRTVRTLARDR